MLGLRCARVTDMQTPIGTRRQETLVRCALRVQSKFRIDRSAQNISWHARRIYTGVRVYENDRRLV